MTAPGPTRSAGWRPSRGSPTEGFDSAAPGINDVFLREGDLHGFFKASGTSGSAFPRTLPGYPGGRIQCPGDPIPSPWIRCRVMVAPTVEKSSKGKNDNLFLPAETGQPAPGEDQVGLVGGAQVGQPVSQESGGVACRPGPYQGCRLVVSPGGVVQETQGPAVVDDLQGIGQQLHVIEPVGRQQSLDDVLDAGAQNGQGDFTAPAPLGKGWKGFVDFNPLPEKIQDLIQAAPDGGPSPRSRREGRFLRWRSCRRCPCETPRLQRFPPAG